MKKNILFISKVIAKSLVGLLLAPVLIILIPFWLLLVCGYELYNVIFHTEASDGKA